MPSRTPPDISGAELNFSERMSYGDYLRLDQLLGCQAPLSESHDELLFITVHHVSELWIKLLNHELTAARERIRHDDTGPALKMLARVHGVLGQMIQLWEVLSTMTPADYLSFRDSLGHASGFQSFQYRALEFIMGAKDERLIAPHAHRPEIVARLERLLREPSLYDEVIALMARRGFEIEPAHLQRDFSQPYRANDSVRRAWIAVYGDTERHWNLYEIAEKLVDVEDWFQLWRYRHVSVVMRIIGQKQGTGGTAGVAYLRQAVGRPFFPELFDVRTAL